MASRECKHTFTKKRVVLWRENYECSISNWVQKIWINFVKRNETSLLKILKTIVIRQRIITFTPQKKVCLKTKHAFPCGPLALANVWQCRQNALLHYTCLYLIFLHICLFFITVCCTVLSPGQLPIILVEFVSGNLALCGFVYAVVRHELAKISSTILFQSGRNFNHWTDVSFWRETQ